MIILRFLLFVALVTTNSLVFAASFACEKASTNVEKLICANSELSKLDSDLASAYGYVLSNASSKSNRSELIADQKKWIQNVRDKCNDASCLTLVYLKRTNALTLIKTSHSQARYVVGQNERSASVADLQGSLNRAGIPGKLSECNLMIRLVEQRGSGRGESYGAICNFNARTIMICNDTMVGKLTVKLYGFSIAADMLTDFTSANCPSGG